MRAITVVLLSFLAVACMSSGAPRPSVTPSRPGGGVESQLRGRWTLTALETQGQPRRASGQASFDEFNNISLRAELEPGEAGATPPRTVLLDFSAKAVVQGDAISYVGLQQRASADQMVPSGSNPSDWRRFSVNGDTLQMWLEDGGGRRLASMTFQRAE